MAYVGFYDWKTVNKWMGCFVKLAMYLGGE